MKKIAILAIVSMLVLPLLGFAQEGQNIAVAPLVISDEGSGTFTLIETRWPDFYKYVPAGGCSGLSNYSKKRKIEGTPTSLYPICGSMFCYVTDAIDPSTGTLHSYPNAGAPAGYNVVYEYAPSNAEYVPISDLGATVNFDGDWAEYRDVARILVTWTIRLEGYKNIIQPNRKHDPWFSGGCGGTTYQSFPEGDVYTKLFVNGSPIGNPAIMTIPYGGKGSASGVVDPTHTGSVALTPDMFGGSFPATLNLAIKAYNDTCMSVQSPNGMRNLVVTVTPIN
ncbi:MAG: hypothetical protein K9L86_03985 [Candidatus Omnitrophica bacterium]|nr:hypothetical protein [Candidatus Omnitrophota bacterium]